MNLERVRYRIGFPLEEDGGLFPSAGEYRRAVCAGALDQLPDDVTLTLYAYELAERMREAVADAPAELLDLDIPLWPVALFSAAELPVHACREIVTLYPETYSIEVAISDPAQIESVALLLLGGLCFDPNNYLEHLAVLHSAGRIPT